MLLCILCVVMQNGFITELYVYTVHMGFVGHAGQLHFGFNLTAARQRKDNHLLGQLGFPPVDLDKRFRFSKALRRF